MRIILIPIDFSDTSKNAIRYAVSLFNEIPCHFFLLYVNVEGSDYIEKTVYSLGTNILVEKEPISIAQKMEDFKKYVQSISLKDKGHQFSTLNEEGYFLATIRKQVQIHNIELIIMGTKGASEIKEFLVGTRAGDVITKIECDVLVVPYKSICQGFNEVVFTTDLKTFYPTYIFNSLSKLLAADTIKIRLLHVAKSNVPLTKAQEVAKEKVMKHLSEKLTDQISFHVVVSKKVENAIQDFAQSFNSELIIMISKDYNMLQKLFLDTTVEEVSFETQIPLLSLQG